MVRLENLMSVLHALNQGRSLDLKKEIGKSQKLLRLKIYKSHSPFLNSAGTSPAVKFILEIG